MKFKSGQKVLLLDCEWAGEVGYVEGVSHGIISVRIEPKYEDKRMYTLYGRFLIIPFLMSRAHLDILPEHEWTSLHRLAIPK